MNTKISYLEEKWKTIELDVETKNDNIIQISNFGRVRTFNKISAGKILNGSLQEGFKIIRLKLIQNKDPEVNKVLDTKRKRIEKLIAQNSTLKKELATFTKRNPNYKTIKTQIEVNVEKITKLRLEYRLIFDEEQKRCTVYKHFLTHRMVAKYFCKKASKKQDFVIHIDHDKLNNHFTNLRWATMEEVGLHWITNPNVIAAKERRKLDKTGKYSKLNHSNVVAIKKLLAKGKTLKEIATKYGVSDMQIYRIKTGENWSHITID
ncbi:MAG: HNH endonuclease [Saprospirales bacterium]|nr:HNH endonuclease [Saprospirales bacterium]